jgi:hypothetical protein
MAVDLLNPCYCPVESKLQLLARLNQNLVTLFTSMASNFEGVEVDPQGCGCTETQILSAINQNIVNFGQTYTGGGSGSEVAMPANTAAAGASGEYALSGTKRADYVDGVGWVFLDAYQIP